MNRIWFERFQIIIGLLVIVTLMIVMDQLSS